MPKLIHEVWEEIGDGGMVLHTCCLVGPKGDGCRRMLSQMARMITTFEASSHFEAMTIYHQFLGREPYAAVQAWDYEPYPDDWLSQQHTRSAGD